MATKLDTLSEIRFPVGVQDELGLVEYRSVAWGDHADLVALELLHVVPDDGPEGHHDLGVVTLGTLVDGRTFPGEHIEVAWCDPKKSQEKRIFSSWR